jgi:hypothetical protein
MTREPAPGRTGKPSLRSKGLSKRHGEETGAIQFDSNSPGTQRKERWLSQFCNNHLIKLSRKSETITRSSHRNGIRHG